MLEAGIQWRLVEHGVVHQDMVDATSDFFKKGLFWPLICQNGIFLYENFGDIVFNKQFFIYLSFHFSTVCYISFCSLGNRLSDDNSLFGKHPTGCVHMGVKGQVPSNYVIFAHFLVNLQIDLINSLIHSNFNMFLNLQIVRKFLKKEGSW